MARKERYTVNDIKEALIKANGFYSKAAESLGCSINTIQNYINRYPDIAQTTKDIRHKRDDFVETMFMKGIQEGNPTLIIFYLKTQMRDRGYSEKESSSSDNSITITHKFAGSLDNKDEPDLSI